MPAPIGSGSGAPLEQMGRQPQRMRKASTRTSISSRTNTLLLLYGLVVLLLLSCSCSAQPLAGTATLQYVHLRAAVILADPFAVVQPSASTSNSSSNSNVTITGYHMDLIRAMEEYALEMNISLTVDVEESPFPKYGDALNLISTDCVRASAMAALLTEAANTNATPTVTATILQNETDSTSLHKDCWRYDLILGDYYVNSERAAKVNFLPPFIRTSISAIKVQGPKDQWGDRDYTLVRDAVKAQVPICATDGTYAKNVAQAKYPNATWALCGPKMGDCLQALKNQTCLLYTADEHKLKAAAVLDPTLSVTGEQLQQQFFSWPMSYRVNDTIHQLFKQLLFQAVEKEKLDDLYYQYFEVKTCPLGNAGEFCELNCDPEHGQANQLGVCVCDSTRWAGADCATELPEERNDIPLGVVLMGYAMFGINISFCLFSAIWLFIKRDHYQVKLSQPFFLALVLVGCIISSSTILAMVHQQDTVDDHPNAWNATTTTSTEDANNKQELIVPCMSAVWLYSIGFCITFGALFAKLRRAYIIFSSAMNMRRVQVSITETMSIVGALVLLDGIILSVWTIVDPLTYQREIVNADVFGYPLESVGNCACESWKIFAGLIAGLHSILLLIGCWYCYKSRHIPDDFSDANYVVLAMIGNAQIFVIAVPVLLIVADTNPGTSAFVRSIVIFMNDFVVVLVIFGNLFVKVWRMPSSDRNNARKSIQTAMKSYHSRNVLSESSAALGSSTLVPRRTNSNGNIRSSVSQLSEPSEPFQVTTSSHRRGPSDCNLGPVMEHDHLSDMISSDMQSARRGPAISSESLSSVGKAGPSEESTRPLPTPLGHITSTNEGEGGNADQSQGTGKTAPDGNSDDTPNPFR